MIAQSLNIQILFKETVNPDAAADMAVRHDINKIIIEGVRTNILLNINQYNFSISLYDVLQEYFGFFPDEDKINGHAIQKLIKNKTY